MTANAGTTTESPVELAREAVQVLESIVRDARELRNRIVRPAAGTEPGDRELARFEVQMLQQKLGTLLPAIDDVQRFLSGQISGARITELERLQLKYLLAQIGSTRHFAADFLSRLNSIK